MALGIFAPKKPTKVEKLAIQIGGPAAHGTARALGGDGGYD